MPPAGANWVGVCRGKDVACVAEVVGVSLLARAGVTDRAAPMAPGCTEKAASALLAIMWRMMRRMR